MDFGLVVVGVHAPEFEFGKRAENIDRGIRDHGLTYPIALDNDFATWQAFGNDAWPTKYLFDADGKLVNRWVGFVPGLVLDGKPVGEARGADVGPAPALRPTSWNNGSSIPPHLGREYGNRNI